MPLGTGQLKRQIVGRGAFAVVCLDVEQVDEPVKLIVSPSAELYEEQHYLPAVQIGVEYICLKLLLGQSGNTPHLKIEVTKILTTAVDTSVMMVVYATILAVCDALNLDAQQYVEIDYESRRLCLDL